VKSVDLNHHGTLFAGRTAEWLLNQDLFPLPVWWTPKHCLPENPWHVFYPARKCRTNIEICYQVVYAGKSSLVSYVQVYKEGIEDALVSGFITFIHVDENTPSSHNIEIAPITDQDKALLEEAKALKNK
jgi:acyl-CoA hydrolase